MVVKPWQSYRQQLTELQERGLDVGDTELAITLLRQANYYRLSGYWYPLRQPAPTGRDNRFMDGARLAEVWAIHQFDSGLRAATFGALSTVEVYLRARLGYELGKVNPCAHLDAQHLGPEARGPRGQADYKRWNQKYHKAVKDSREDFVDHHRTSRGGILPVWVAVEVLDWGGLTWLYRFSPRAVQHAVAADFALVGPQLASWLRALNIVRNVCAHHGRLYNKVFAIKPKMPGWGSLPELDEIRKLVERVEVPQGAGVRRSEHWFGARTFGQLSLIQHLLKAGSLEGQANIPEVLEQFPETELFPEASLGTPTGWRDLRLWKK